MTTQTETQEDVLSIKKEVKQIKKLLTDDQKSFIGLLLSLGGVFFMLLGVMVFIALMIGFYFYQLGIFIIFIIAALVVGITSFAIGSMFHK